MAEETPQFVAVTRVKPGREQEFESLMPIIAAAHAQARPHIKDEWRLLRPDRGNSEADAPVYLFMFYGDGNLDDWELRQLFLDTHGDDDGKRLFDQFYDCLDGEQDVYAFSGEVPRT